VTTKKTNTETPVELGKKIVSTTDYVHVWNQTGVIVSVGDGDTFNVKLDVGYRWFHVESLRPKGFDAYEKKGATKKKGLEAKAFVEKYLTDLGLLNGRKVRIVTEKPTYDRYLAHIYYYTQPNMEEHYLNEELFLALKAAKLLTPGSRWNPSDVID
jgi:endonuclease YncB( thermonuclease family)